MDPTVTSPGRAARLGRGLAALARGLPSASRRAPRRVAGPPWLGRLPGLLACLFFVSAVQADEQPEYRLKTAFIYNFIMLTEWPAETGSTMQLCIQGADPFGS